MEKSKLNSCIKRIVTAVILIPLTIGCLYAGYPFVQAFTMLTGTLLAWEWARMVPSARGAFWGILYTFVLAFAVMLGSWIAYFGVLAGALVLAWFKASGETRRNLLVLGVPYISIGVGSILWLYELAGFSLVLWFLLIVWGVDIGGYVFGCTLKGPKLAPKISPNKTWAGLFGGMILAMAVSYGVCWYFGAADWSIFKFYLVMAAILAVIAQIGDLVESAIKRHLGLKDSSNLIPGHGGFFDRVDGLIFAAPFARPIPMTAPTTA